MKKILYIHQYFITPKQGGAIRSYHIAKGMIDKKMDVQVITSHNNPTYEVKQIEGITVHYLPIPYSSDYSFRRRAVAFVRFAIDCLKVINKLPTPDLIYATSTPLTVGMVAWWLRWRRKIPFIFEVRDLWPEAPIQLKIIKSKLVIRLAESVEKKIYRNASQLIALSPGIKLGILQKFPNANISIIPNMADLDFFSSASNEPMQQGYFTIGYFGSFGMSNHLESVLEIAQACQKKELPIRFVLAGQGPAKNTIEASARKRGIRSITFHQHLDRFAIRKHMQFVDAVFISFRDIPVLGTNSPNKFFDGLAAGKLIIANTKGWLKQLVEDHQCGFVVDQDKPEAFPELIKPFLSNTPLLISYQQRARQLAEQQFSKEKLVQQVCDLVEHI